MSQSQGNEDTFNKIRRELPKIFTKDAYPPLQISVDGLVTIEVNALFQFNSVTLHGVALQPDQTIRLEQALVKAMNQATQEVAKRNVARIVQRTDTGA